MKGKVKWIVGLGNPGARYVNTRHNFGFLVVEAFAQKHGWVFTSSKQGIVRTSRGAYQGISVVLWLPQTYMNCSGEVLKRLYPHDQVELQDLLIVVDDKAIPFRSMRLRPSGGHGGHNGLASIEWALSTKEYPRLRMGIGEKGEQQSLEEFVLSPFKDEEKAQLPQVLAEAVILLENWVVNGTKSAMQQIGSEKT